MTDEDCKKNVSILKSTLRHQINEYRKEMAREHIPMSRMMTRQKPSKQVKAQDIIL